MKRAYPHTGDRMVLSESTKRTNEETKAFIAKATRPNPNTAVDVRELWPILNGNDTYVWRIINVIKVTSGCDVSARMKSRATDHTYRKKSNVVEKLQHHDRDDGGGCGPCSPLQLALDCAVQSSMKRGFFTSESVPST